MNTFTYLTSFLSSPPPPRTPPSPASSSSSTGLPSTSSIPSITESTLPTTIDTDTESITSPLDQEENETIYLSARRDPNQNGRIRYSFSTTNPRTNEMDRRRRRAEEIPLPDSPVLDIDLSDGNDEVGTGGSIGWPEIVAQMKDEKEERSLEDEEGEKRLREKEMKKHEKGKGKATEVETGDQSLWGILSRLSPFHAVRLVYVLLRHIIAFIGIPYPKQTSMIEPPQPSQNTTTSIDDDIPPQPPSPTRFFFRRTSAPPSPSPVPSPALLPIAPKPAPRLVPKTLVLDLDETLIHSTSRPRNYGKNSGKGLKVRVVEVVLEGRSTVYTVYKRPWVDFFLRKVSTWYTVIIFTASLPEYADPVIDWLDGGDGGGGMVGGRLFRSDCRHTNGAYVKDLSVVDQDLSRVCLVDNSPASYAINQANGIPIEGWINDPNDECLLDLLPMLDSLRFTNDVRRVLGLRGFGKER